MLENFYQNINKCFCKTRTIVRYSLYFKERYNVISNRNVWCLYNFKWLTKKQILGQRSWNHTFNCGESLLNYSLLISKIKSAAFKNVRYQIARQREI